MANTFLNAVFDGSNTSASTGMNIYTAGSTVTSTVVIGLTLCNTGTSQISANIKLSAGQTVFLAKAIPIPVGSSFEFMAGNKIIMKAGHTLTVSCDIANSLDTVLSIMEITP
jgi:hypothetical protein